MSRNRSYRKHRPKARSVGTSKFRRPTPPTAETRLRNRMLAELYRSEKAIGVNEMVKSLDLPRSSKHEIENGLILMEREGLVRPSGKKRFNLSNRHPLTEATIVMSPSGHAFATELSRRPEVMGPDSAKDPYIASSRLHSGLHGDRVLVAVSPSRRPGKTEAEVISVLKRASRQLAGIFSAEGRHGIVQPDDPRFSFTIHLDAPPPAAVTDGDAVIIELHYTDGTTPRGEIVEILGNPDLVAVQVRLVIDKHKLPYRFSEAAERQANLPPPDPAADNREDLRDIEHVTIDGADAKDFDDAVAVRRTRSGYRLLVSIADVSAFVPVDSDLDREAYERGTSVYLPSTVVPMLPENLSNNLCSLLPDTDRLAITVTLDFDRQGRLRAKSFTRSIIRSHQRFTYNTVEQIVTGRDPELRHSYQQFLKPLEHAAELARLLQRARQERGSIAFSLPEAAVAFDENGRVESIRRTERYFSHQIIEEFMLAANEAVAQIFVEQGQPLLFRIHDLPSTEKIEDFIVFSRTLGLELPGKPATPEWYNQLIEQVRNTPHEYIVNNLLLRTMQQARYSSDNVGHFGLASLHYAHFTSPIRRYPDLIVHRQLCRLMAGKRRKTPESPTKNSPAPSLSDDALHLSQRERVAVAAERDLIDRLKRQFMARHLGESFAAVISGVGETACYIELLDFSVDGIVPLSTLTDDYYILDEKRHRLVGDTSGRTLQIGDLVRVTLQDVGARQHGISFRIEHETEQSTPRRRR
ncbi:MAG: ribonuclease R [Desulfobulbaceae bacterium]|nr:ribonuclease R [Desulfobulbaceae bacterium]